MVSLFVNFGRAGGVSPLIWRPSVTERRIRGLTPPARQAIYFPTDGIIGGRRLGAVVCVM